MSDTDDKDKDPKKNGKTDREKSQVEPVSKDEKFTVWLEGLFAGPGHFPEKLDVRVVRGKDFATMGPMVKQVIYGPKDPKPDREQLVHLANEILARIQQDCDQQRKQVVYHVAAAHFSRESEFYERYLLRRVPGQAFKHGPNGDEENDEEADGIERRFSGQVMRHQEQMFNLHGSVIEGFIDRQDRLVERLILQNEKLSDRITHLFEALERSRSLEVERQERLEWAKLKTRGAEKMLDMGLAVAPPLLNQLVGKPILPSADTLETVTLKKFFESVTKEQSDVAFGTYDDTPEHKPVTQGILSQVQAEILYRVAHGQMPPDTLDQLMPAGAQAINMEQLGALQQVFQMEQLAPLFLVFEARRKKQPS